MARKHTKDRGMVEKPKGSGKWWVRLYVEVESVGISATQSANPNTVRSAEGRCPRGEILPEQYRRQATAKPILFSEYFVTWLKIQPARGKKSGTIKTYEWRLRKHALPVFGTTPLSAIIRPQLKSWASSLLEKNLDFDRLQRVVDGQRGLE